MIGEYTFLIPRGGEHVTVNSNSIRNDHYRFYAELLDYFVNYQEGDKFVVNLGQINDSDSSCVASFVGLLQATKKENIELILEDVSPNMKQNLEVSRTHSVFNFQNS